MVGGGGGWRPGGRRRAVAVGVVLWGLVLAVAIGGVLRPSAPGRHAAAQESAEDDPEQWIARFEPQLGVEVPPNLGQASFPVYVAETGHTLVGAMLDYWRSTGGRSVYGNPISEPFADAAGRYSQAFERGVLQYRSERLHTVDPIMGLMPIGEAALAARLDAIRPDGRRAAGGGDRRGAVWRPLNPNGDTAARAAAHGGRFVAETRHTITGDLLAWYQANDGPFYLGNPLSEPFAERGMIAQLFEGGLLMTGEGGTRLAPLVAELAPRLGIDTEPVAQNGLPLHDETLYLQAPNPLPQGDPLAASGARRIEVSISEQRLRAYQGETVILDTPVSTGVDPNGTDEGRFRVRYKLVAQDMEGITDESGEVVAVGARTPEAGETPPAGERYVVEDVPHVMYFNLEAEALHGAYWHNNFGQQMSHGCVNLPLDVAAFLYGWAPLGTEVWVHQ